MADIRASQGKGAVVRLATEDAVAAKKVVEKHVFVCHMGSLE